MFTPEQEAGYQQFVHWREKPEAFVYDCFGAVPQEHQIEIMRSVAHAGANGQPTGTTVRSGHGVGKTCTQAWLVFYYLFTRPLSKVPTTAPTWHQVKNVLWAEIEKWYRRFRFAHLFKLDTTRLAAIGREREWFAIGITSNRPDRIEGFHAPYLLFLVDEAKGVPDGIFDAIDGALTQGGIRAYFSTPGSPIGKFYDSHHRLARFFRTFHVNGEHVATVSKAWVEEKRLEWGEDSAIFQAKVRGEFPQEGDDILIPLDFIRAAEESFMEIDEHSAERLLRPGPHRVIGADIARYGFNETVAAEGTSHGIEHLESWKHASLVDSAARLKQMVDLSSVLNPIERVGIDDSGVGGGVTDILKSWNVDTLPVLFGAQPTDPEHFYNLKAEIAWRFRQALEQNHRNRKTGKPGTFGLVKDDRLSGQLAALRKRTAMRRGVPAGLVIMDPDDPLIPAAELPKGLRASPDRAHAAMICYYTAAMAAQVAVGTLHTPDDASPVRSQRGRLSRYIMGRSSGPLRDRTDR